jgi:uncharacterized membrane protein YeiH
MLRSLLGAPRTALASQTTRLAAAVLAAVWIVLLITVPGVKLNIWCKSSDCVTLLVFQVDGERRRSGDWRQMDMDQ